MSRSPKENDVLVSAGQTIIYVDTNDIIREYKTPCEYSYNVGELLKYICKKCVHFIIEMLENKNKIRDFLKFCEITRIVVTRRNEACFTFEIKKHIQEILQD